MAEEILFRIYGFTRSLYRRTIGKLQRKVIKNQTQSLNIQSRDRGLEVFENQESGPRMAYFELQLENDSDIEFDIERTVLWIEIDAENLPTRNSRSTYPVGIIDEDRKIALGNKIGRIDANGATIGRRESSSNVEFYTIEFEIPGWAGEVSKVYVDGFVEVQRDIRKEFSFKVNEKKILNTPINNEVDGAKHSFISIR